MPGPLLKSSSLLRLDEYYSSRVLLLVVACRQCVTRNAPVVETVPRLGRSLILYLIVPNWRMSETTSQKLEIILPETRSIIIRVMMASFKFVERGVFGPDHPPRRRPQASQERHSSYGVVNTVFIPGNHHASVRSFEP